MESPGDHLPTIRDNKKQPGFLQKYIGVKIRLGNLQNNCCLTNWTNRVLLPCITKIREINLSPTTLDVFLA